MGSCVTPLTTMPRILSAGLFSACRLCAGAGLALTQQESNTAKARFRIGHGGRKCLPIQMLSLFVRVLAAQILWPKT
jgi:hypothetical protein